MNPEPLPYKVVRLHLDTLDDPPDNPNRMSQERLTLLEEATVAHGFLQPLLTRKLPSGRYQIVDGVHRAKAARAQGLTHLTSVVVECSDERARLLQVGLNRLRGELDLSHVGRILDELDNAGIGQEELRTTGYGDEEIADLLRSIREAEAPLDLGVGTPPAPPQVDQDVSTNTKPHALELAFKTKAERDRAKRGLRKAAGKGGSLEAGLLALLGDDK